MPALLKRITSKRDGDFYCLNCFHSYIQNVCKNHNYCYIETPKENDKILKYNYGEKSIKVSFVIYADLECLLEKIDTYQNHPQKSSTTKKNKLLASVFSFLHIVHLMQQKVNLNVIEVKDCMKNFLEDLKEYATKIINYEKKK